MLPRLLPPSEEKPKQKPKQKPKINLTDNLTETIIEEESIEEDIIEEKSTVDKIPPFEIFSSYAVEKNPKICVKALKLKYDTWVESDWHDGHGSKILNWKVKLLNTLPYIKERVLADSELTPEERTRKANASTI